MQRGPKPTPTALKLVTGNPGKRPPLVPNEASVPASRPSPPEDLPDDAKVEWGRVIERLYECGLMTDIDRAALAAYCNAYATWLSAVRTLRDMAQRDPQGRGLMIRTTNGNVIQNPLVGTIRCAQADVVRYAAEFGMTPSARSRIDVGIGSAAPPAEGQDPAPNGTTRRGYF